MANHTLLSVRLALFVGLVWALAACAAPLPDVPLAARRGQALELVDAYGVFYAYLPRSAPAEAEVLALIHGTPAKDESAEETARYYLLSWVDFAEEHGYVLIAPAFNQEDFSSRYGDHALGGYRGLFGRRIGADAWLLRLVTAYQRAFGEAGAPFLLYGHSAGGQFLARFLVVHPERVRRAVITAAGTYPQPVGDVAWPFGMGELHADVEWDAATIRRVDVIPDRQKWLAATQVPLSVIVGLNDTSELPAYPGQQGKNRFTIGRNWVADMQRFAGDNGLQSRFQLAIIPGKGHSMQGLLPYSQPALLPAE